MLQVSLLLFLWLICLIVILAILHSFDVLLVPYLTICVLWFLIFCFPYFQWSFVLTQKKKITAVTENLGSTGADLGSGVGVGVGAVPRHGNFWIGHRCSGIHLLINYLIYFYFYFLYIAKLFFLFFLYNGKHISI